MSKEPLIYFNNPPYCESRQAGAEDELIEFDRLVPPADRGELSSEQADRQTNATLHFVTVLQLSTDSYQDDEGRVYALGRPVYDVPDKPIKPFYRFRLIVIRDRNGPGIWRRILDCKSLHTCGNITQLPHRIFDACEFEYVQFHKRVPKANTPVKRLELLQEYAEKVLYERDQNWIDVVSKAFKESGVPLRPRCFACNTQSKHRHHIILIKYGGTNDPRNIEPLCERCHRIIHPHLRDKH